MNEELATLEEIARIANIVKLGSEIATREALKSSGRKARIENLAKAEVLNALWLYLTSQSIIGLWAEVDQKLHDTK